MNSEAWRGNRACTLKKGQCGDQKTCGKLARIQMKNQEYKIAAFYQFTPMVNLQELQSNLRKYSARSVNTADHEKRSKELFQPAFDAYRKDEIDEAELKRRKKAAQETAGTEYPPLTALDAAFSTYEAAVKAREDAEKAHAEEAHDESARHRNGRPETRHEGCVEHDHPEWNRGNKQGHKPARDPLFCDHDGSVPTGEQEGARDGTALPLGECRVRSPPPARPGVHQHPCDQEPG